MDSVGLKNKQTPEVGREKCRGVGEEWEKREWGVDLIELYYMHVQNLQLKKKKSEKAAS